jgi:hypothetical protein
MEGGKPSRAYDIYMSLVRAYPGDDAATLGAARSGAMSGRLNQAVIFYEILLEKYPRDPALNAEIAQVYMLLGDRESAERYAAVEASLRGAAPEDNAKALDILAERTADLQIHGTLRFGAVYDSNANLGPAGDTMDLGPWRVTLDGAGAIESFGAYAGLDLDMSYRPYRDTPWRLVADARMFWKGYDNSDLYDRRSHESQSLRLALGVRRVGERYMVETRFKGEVYDSALFQRVSAYGPEFTLAGALSPGFMIIAGGGVDKRIYSRDHFRDGYYGWTGLFGRFILGDAGHEISVGGRLLLARPDKWALGHRGFEQSLRLTARLPLGFEFSPFVTHTREFYRGPGTILERVKREDDRIRGGGSLTWHVNDNWSAELLAYRTVNTSTSGLYTYKQNFVSLGMAYKF